MENKIRELSNANRRKRLLKRVVAFLSIVVLLFTVNSLKLTAITLSRVPACGLKKHIHKAKCYDGNGNLICGKVEHQHTDACYQVAPNDLTLEIEGDGVAVDEPSLDLSLSLDDGVLQVDDSALQLDDSLLEPDNPPVDDAGSGAQTNTSQKPTYELGEKAKLSKIIKKTKLGVSIDEVNEVGVVDYDGTQASLLSIEQIDGDYIIAAARDFDEADLAIIAEKGIEVVRLVGGRMPAEVVEQGDVQTPSEVAEETSSEVAGQPDPQTPSEVSEETPSEEAEETPSETAEQDDVQAPADAAEQGDVQTDVQATEETDPQIDVQTDLQAGAESTEDEISSDIVVDDQVAVDEFNGGESDALALDLDDAVVVQQQGEEAPVEEQGGEAPVEDQGGIIVTEAEVPADEQGEETPAEEQVGEVEIPADVQGEEPPAEEQAGDVEAPADVQGGVEAPADTQADEEEQSIQQSDMDEVAVEVQDGGIEVEAPAEEQGDVEASADVQGVEAPVDVQGDDDEALAEEQGVEATADVQGVEAPDEEQGDVEDPAEVQGVEAPVDVQGGVEAPVDVQGDDDEALADVQGVEAPVEEQGGVEAPADVQGDDDEALAEEQRVETPADVQGVEAPADTQSDEEDQSVQQSDQVEALVDEQTDEQADEVEQSVQQSDMDEVAADTQVEEEEQADEEETLTDVADEAPAEEEEQADEEEQAAEEENASEEDVEAEEEQPTEEENASEVDEEAVDGEEQAAEEEQADEAAEEEQGDEATEEEQGDEAAEEEQADEAPAAAIYSATIDLSEVETYPISLMEIMAKAVPSDAEEEGTEAEAAEEVIDAAKENVDAAEEEVEAAPEASAWTIEYDTSLFSIEAVEDDYLITPIQSFERTQIIVTNDSRYELTLVNCVLADESKDETVEQEAASVYASTIDLTDVEAYPLSLNEMMSAARAEQPDEEQAQEQAQDAQPDEEQAQEQTQDAQPDETEQTQDEQPALNIGYDENLLSIEIVGDDHLITPIQSFERTVITVESDGRYELTLVNCALTEVAEAGEAEAFPAQDFEGQTDYIRVVVSAPTGAFPAETTMKVVDVADEKTLTDIEDTVSEEFVEVRSVHAVDITFTDVDGNEIEPLVPISVVMSLVESEQIQKAETVVVHVDDEGATQVVESESAGEAVVSIQTGDGAQLPDGEGEAIEEDAAASQDAVTPQPTGEGEAFQADSFSIYAMVQTEAIETRYIAADGTTWNISVGYGKEAEIPAGASLAVSEVVGEDAEAYLAQTAEALRGKETITLARFFDITILDSEGQEVQPKAAVEVKAVLADGTQDTVKAVHFAEEGPEIIEASQDDEAVVFEAEGFSVYGIVYTVDFHYGVDGRIFGYGIPGGDCASLRDLLSALNVAADDPETDSDEIETFISRIADVKFTNPELVRVCPVEADTTVGALRAELGLESQYSAALTEEDRAEIDVRVLTAPDWALFSLLPFTSDEALTVTMENGDSFIIVVTDAQIATRVLAADGVTYKITLTFGPEAEIPLDAELKAEEIPEYSDAWRDCVRRAVETTPEGELGDIAFARFFDIEILSGGQSTEPAAPVLVTIAHEEPIDIPEGAALSVVHFGDTGTEIITDVTCDETGREISYQQGSFSITGTIVSGAPETTYDGRTAKYILAVAHEGKEYVVLYDGTLQEADSFTAATVEADYPMQWNYDGQNIYHNSLAVGFDGWSKLPTDFYYRYLDANEVGATSNDTLENTVLYGKEGEKHVAERFQKHLASVVYDADAHTVRSDIHPEWYLGVVQDADGTLRLAGQRSQAEAAAIRMARVLNDTSNNHDKPELVNGTRYNTVNHIDISVEGTAAIRVPLEPGTYYYGTSDNPQSLVVTPRNPVILHLYKKVNVTPDDVKHARITAYTKDADGTHHPVDEMFVISGYSQNADTDESTAQVRVEGLFKVTDLRKIPVDDASLKSIKNDTTNYNWSDDILYMEDGQQYADLDVIPSNLRKAFTYTNTKNDGNTETIEVGENNFEGDMDDNIRSLRLRNRIYYAISTEKQDVFDLEFNGQELYAKPEDIGDASKKLTFDGMVTLSASFDFWDSRNECPAIHWDNFDNNDRWRQGDIPLSMFKEPIQGSGMDFALGDADVANVNVLGVQITKYIVDKAGNRIATRYPTRNTVTVYRRPPVDNGKEWDKVKGLHVDQNESGKATVPEKDYYFKVHDRTITVGTGGMGSIYDYDVSDGMIYVAEHTDPDELSRDIVDQNGLTWHFVGTHLETEYVWRGDGILNRNHFSPDYTREDADLTPDGEFDSVPEVLGYYEDVTGLSKLNNFLEYTIYNVYEPDKTEVKVRKTWKHQNGTPAEAPDGAEVRVTIGRYHLVEDPEHPVTGTLQIDHTVDFKDDAVLTNFNAGYKVKQGSATIRTGTYTGGPVELTGLPAGKYTVELETSYTGSEYTVENSDASQSVTIPAGGTGNVSFTSTVRKPALNTIQVRITNSIENNANYQDRTYTFMGGDKIIINLSRPGGRHASFNMTMKVNNGTDVYREYITPMSDDYLTFTQVIEYQLPESYPEVYKIDFWHNWGTSDMWINSVSLPKGSTAPMLTSFGMPRMANLAVPQSVEPEVQTENTANGPESGLPGWIYVEDTVEDTTTDPPITRLWSAEVVLNGAPWEETLQDLDLLDEHGNPYRYFIKSVKETGVATGTTPVFELAQNGHVLTSSDKPVLGITNEVPNEPPKLHIRKLDDGRHALTGAKFSLTFAPPAGSQEAWTRDFTIDSPDGLYTTEPLPIGTYTLEETEAPTGYGKLQSAITFAVDSEYRITSLANSSPDVTFDGDTYLLSVVNRPDVPANSLYVMKRWQNYLGEEEIPENGEVTLTLKRTKLTDKTKNLHVSVVYRSDYGTAMLEKAILVNHDSVSVSWNDGEHFDWDANRVHHQSNIAGVQFTDNVDHTDTEHTPTVSWTISNLANIQEDYIYVSFVYDLISDNWFNAMDYIDTTDDGVDDRAKEKKQRCEGLLEVLRANREPNVVEDTNSTPIPGTDTADDNAFSETLTLNRSNQWQYKLYIKGAENADPKPEGYDLSLPATDSQRRPYSYYVVETPLPAGYAVSYSGNNTEGVRIGTDTTQDEVGSGLIMVYNRRTTVDLKILKVDKLNPETPLENAKFTLSRLNPDRNGDEECTAIATVTTDAQGKAVFGGNGQGAGEFPGLAPGEYYRIQETQMPDGYVRTGDGKIFVKVTAEGVKRIAYDDQKTPDQWAETGDDDMVSLTASAMTVKNEPGVALPSTGGPGTTLYYAAGAALLLLAVAMLIFRKKAGEE